MTKHAHIASYIAEIAGCLKALDHGKIEHVISILLTAYKTGRQIFIMGNGGSATTASHLAADLGKGTLARVYDEKEKRFKVHSLTDNVALLTAYANDVSFDDVYVQQLRNLVEKGDVTIVLSGSGNSVNLVKAVKYAKKSGAKTIGILGFKTGGKLGTLVDCAILCQSDHYGPCEDVQLVVSHIIVSRLAKIKDQNQRKGERV